LEEKYLPNKLSQLMDKGIETSVAIVMDVAVKKEVIGGKPDSIITLDPGMIFRVNSKYDSSIAPQGCHLLSAWMTLESAKIKDREYVNCMFQKLEYTMHKIFSCEDHEANSASVIRKMIFGTAIGFYPSPSMTRSKRPSISFPTVKNIYLVGDGTNASGIGGSSDIAFSSAIECYKAIKDNGI
jgi:phytoene dehydrogenase-like protein